MLWEEGWSLGCGMFCSKCLYHSLDDLLLPIPEPFSLPAPIPQWPPGSGFASGMVGLGELEVFQISKFDFIWGYNLFTEKKQGVSFYKPVGVPRGFFTLGHYCQSIEVPLRGFVLVAREVSCCNPSNSPALLNPRDYVLVWSSYNWSDENLDSCGYFWLPQPPIGYKALGFVVTTKPEKPDLEEVKCVRADLTDECDVYNTLVDNSSISPFGVWSTKPKNRGMLGRGVSLGTFFCSSSWSKGQELSVACLKSISCTLHAMPNLDQIHALVKNYGPTVFFHPDEAYLPSSVSWFFRNGALLYKKGEGDEEPIGCNIDEEGSNLPVGGTNDGEYWIDLPSDSLRENIKLGNIESSKLYVHVKPALGGTFTDIVMWVFCPFNGPGTLKIGMMNIGLSKVGQHVGDWEHFTLRISNFTGELWGVYFSQHSGGEWLEIFGLEFICGNKPIIYSSKHGHSSYPHPGLYLQGSSKLGVGVRNDAACSEYFVDSSSKYEIVAAEYLGNGVVIEPNWLQYMREWGPKTVYDSRAELDRVLNILPSMVQDYAKKAFCKLPAELFREEGPTGPKEKNNWVGDERC